MTGWIESIAVLLSGYAIFSAVVLAASHFRAEYYPEQDFSRITGIFLLAVLAGIQVLHAHYFLAEGELFSPSLYILLLFSVAPFFYLYSRPLLYASSGFSLLQLCHFLPVIGALFLPFSWGLPLAFALGAVYLLWLAYSVYALRAQRNYFRLELMVLGAVFALALLVLLLGLLLPLVPERLFFALYASAIGGAFMLINMALYLTPQMSEQVAEAARETYATSTLGQVDCDATLTKLQQLMTQDQLYRDSQLDLPTLAEQLGLSAHQLSELINTRLGKHFPRYIREQRVAAAQDMLLAEPSASVLSVGLSVGFSSQSNFYEAFREIAGTTPGKFRKLRHNEPPGGSE